MTFAFCVFIIKIKMEDTNNSLDLSVIREWIIDNRMSDHELGNKLRGFYWETVNKRDKVQ